MSKMVTVNGIDVGTFEDINDLFVRAFPYAGGMILLEVYTKAVGKVPVTSTGSIIKTLKKIKSLPKEERPRWVSIVFGGWDEDPRPIVQIPECRSWCRQFVLEAGPELLSVLMWETEVKRPGIDMKDWLVFDAGFGIVKVLVTAGYGVSEVPEGIDASESAHDDDDDRSLTYQLTNEGAVIASSILEHKAKI